jgi:hypothetical protein
MKMLKQGFLLVFLLLLNEIPRQLKAMEASSSASARDSERLKDIVPYTCFVDEDGSCIDAQLAYCQSNIQTKAGGVSLDTEATAVREFAAGKLDVFDANGGDSQCEARASKCCDLADALLAVEDNRFFLSIAYLLNLGNIPAYKIRSLNGIEQDRPKGLRPAVDFKKKGLIMNTTKAGSMRNYAQRWLAADSVSYVRACAQQLKDQELVNALTLLKKDDFGRLMIPFYPFIKAIMGRTITMQRPLIVRVRRFCDNPDCAAGSHTRTFFFRSLADDGIRCAVPTEADLNRAALVYEGWSCSPRLFKLTDDRSVELLFNDRGAVLPDCEQACVYFNDFAKLDMLQVILADAAQHDQWRGDSRSDDEQRADLVEQLRTLAPNLAGEIAPYNAIAQGEGFALRNPTMFLIEHVSAGFVRDFIREIDVTRGYR